LAMFAVRSGIVNIDPITTTICVSSAHSYP
jgi:hypothetical protein